MLELIRKYRSLFMVIFVLSSAGMIISMFAHPTSDSMAAATMGSGVAAKVEGEEISTQELLTALQRQMQQMEEVINQQAAQSGDNPETRKFLEGLIRSQVNPDRTLQQLIQQKFMLATARNLGLAASSDHIRGYIQANPAFQKEGRFDPLAYRQMVQDPGIYEEQVAAQVRVNSLNKVFEAALGMASPTQKLEREFLERKLKLATLVLDPKTFPEPKSVSPEEATTFAANPASEAQLKAAYEQNKAKYVVEDQVHARHILIKDDAGGEAKAKEILADIQAKKITFEAAAKAHSADPSNKDKGGDLGFFGKSMMDPEFEKAAFALTEPGQLTPQPVKSSFGYHLIELVARKPGSTKEFDAVKKELAETVLLNEKRAAKAREWVATWTSAGKVPPESETTKLGLKWNELTWTPLDEGLGPVSALQDQRSLVLALGADKPLLGQALTQGENLVLVKYIGSGDAPAAKDKNAPPPAPAASAEEQRLQTAFEYFLRTRFEGLEKDKKIIKSEKVLGDLRARWNAQNGATPN